MRGAPLLIGCAAAAPALSAAARNITVFRIGQARYLDASPEDMNTGDARGDLYFVLGSFKHVNDPSPEMAGPNLTVTRMVIEVDDALAPPPTPGNAGYGFCNACHDSGTDPNTNLPCTPGEYSCDCQQQPNDGLPPFVWAPCGNLSTVGTYSITMNLPYMYGYLCNGTVPGRSSRNGYWTCNTAIKTGGLWFSTPAAGRCRGGRLDGTCSWRVVGGTRKAVWWDCGRPVLTAAVRRAGAGCFDACGADARNESSQCWIDCFYAAVVGPDAGSAVKPGGMPMDDIVAAFNAPFDSDDPNRGGCPSVVI